jgi:hypothetical protein
MTIPAGVCILAETIPSRPIVAGNLREILILLSLVRIPLLALVYTSAPSAAFAFLASLTPFLVGGRCPFPNVGWPGFACRVIANMACQAAVIAPFEVRTRLLVPIEDWENRS